MQTSLLIATMLVAVPLATAVPASAVDCREGDPGCEAAVTAVEEAGNTLGEAVDDVEALTDDGVIEKVLGLLNCEVTPDGHIVCR